MICVTKNAKLAAPRLVVKRTVTLFLWLCVSSSLASGAPPEPAVRPAPPEPVVTDAERLAELKGRRDQVAAKIGPAGALLLLGGEPRVYANDVSYEFRQENNLYYLTALAQQGATLVMLPGHARHREILFLPRRSPALETWTGHMYSPQQANQISGVGEIWDAREFEPFLAALRLRRPYRPKSENVLLSASPAEGAGGYEQLYAAANRGEANLYLLLPRDEESREYKREQDTAARFARTPSGYALRSAWPIFTELRLRKSPLELKYLQHAVDITAEALGRAMAAADRAQWEYEIEAELDYVFKKRHADNWGYPSIVGSGPNATTLHYEESSGPIKKTDLILMDVGAEYQHYSADVTRTFPANGKFSATQADIYNVVLAAQEAGFRSIRPGVMFQQVHLSATEVVKDGLLRLGLITDRNSDQHRIWFMHGTSHFLGMNVHDVGGGGPLTPGMVFTVEPGIYIREDALDHLPKTAENEKFIAAVRPAFEKYKNIGVRIEDDVVVTQDAFRNLSGSLPRTIPDIESFMSRAARELSAR